jgi:polysaccharide pyruvyl transferase WcaK-like protein
MIVSKYKKQLFFYGIGINFHDIQNTIYKKKIQSIFENASEIYVRDTFSQAYLEEIQIESQLIHDPVFEDA